MSKKTENAIIGGLGRKTVEPENAHGEIVSSEVERIGGLFEIPVSEIVETKNVRENYDRDKLKELARSIQESGQLQPVGVEKDGSKYRLIYGFRRVRAIKEFLPGQKVRAIVIEAVSNENETVRKIVENEQRVNLSEYELSLAVDELSKDLKQNEIAIKLGVSIDRVKKASQYLNILNRLEESVTSHFLDLQADIVRAGVKIKDGNDIVKFLNKCKDETFSVRQAREYADKLLARESRKANKTPSNTSNLSQDESKQAGTGQTMSVENALKKQILDALNNLSNRQLENVWAYINELKEVE